MLDTRLTNSRLCPFLPAFFLLALPAVLLAGACFLPVSGARAQGCNPGLELRPRHELEYHTFENKKKKPAYIARHRVLSLEQLEDRTLAHLKCVFYEADLDLIRSFDYFIGCKDNLLILDKEVLSDPENLVLFEDKTFTFDGKNLHYPAHVQPGDTLRRAVHTVQVSTGAVKMANVETALVNRRVEGIQELSTPAGTFRCYKISYQHELRRGNEEMRFTRRKCMVEYVVPGLGPIRSEEYSKRGKLIRYTELVSFRLDPSPAE